MEILQRQNKVLDLKILGTSFRKIHARLKESGYDVSLGTVYSDYIASLERLQEINLDKTELLRVQELEKLEEWEFELSVASRGKKLSVMERESITRSYVLLQNQRDKFQGISKPKVIKIQTDADFARALGIGVEELPRDDES